MSEYVIEEFSALIEQFESGDLEKKSEALRKMFIQFGESALSYYIVALEGPNHS